MCGGPEQSKQASTTSSPSPVENQVTTERMNTNPAAENDDSFSNLLELAASNDVEGFKQALGCVGSSINEIGLWYGRKKGSKQMVLEHRTPLMVAATYGSIDVLKLILDQSKADLNLSCGPDKSTALHCAASGGSCNAHDTVKLLLSAGADPNCFDSNNHRPADVISVPPKIPSMKASILALLSCNDSDVLVNEPLLQISTNSSDSSSPRLSLSPKNESPSSPLDSVSSPMAITASEKKEYPLDPSLPDIKNGIYSTDEFRMFSFKIRPCSRAYSHDWTECPFVHPGENARRRDPRKYHYSCVPCPDFRKGACRRGDMCEYAHGVFECWLHPAQYRTRLCKDGPGCARRVCFFAHLPEELRPLYASTGSAVPSPRSSAFASMDMAAAMSLLPGSPSTMSPSAFSQSMSPSTNGMSNSSMAWPQPNVPTLHLPGSNFQSSRLRSSINARDIPPDDYLVSGLDVHQQLLNDLACFSQPQFSPASSGRTGRSQTLAPCNFDELFSAEMASSPRYSDPSSISCGFSPSHRSALLSQFQQQQQSMLSPINTNAFSPKKVDHSLFSPGRMSPRSLDPISPMGSSRLSALAQREKQHQQLRSLSSRDLGSNNPIVGSPEQSWSKWGSPTGKADWSVNGDDFGIIQRSSSSLEEPDLSWVQTLVKESPPDMKQKRSSVSTPGGAPVSSSGESLNSISQADSVDHSVIGAWLEQMQLDQLVA